MSKDFAMLNATRKLEKYLSHEYENLESLSKNVNIPFDLFAGKVDHYNNLVNTLNELFGILSDSPSSQLFTHYELKERVELTNDGPIEISSDSTVMEVQEEPVRLQVKERIEFSSDNQEDENPSEENPLPPWEAAGYESQEQWLDDKEKESAEIVDDLSLNVNVGLSKHRAEQALTEYDETSDRDISTYLPEEDEPVNVLPFNESHNERPTEDLNYLNHTVDNIRVDNDPIQIAGVETAVEREGEKGRKGTEIDISEFAYKSERVIVNNLIDDDIMQLQVKRELPRDEA